MAYLSHSIQAQFTQLSSELLARITEEKALKTAVRVFNPEEASKTAHKSQLRSLFDCNPAGIGQKRPGEPFLTQSLQRFRLTHTDNPSPPTSKSCFAAKLLRRNCLFAFNQSTNHCRKIPQSIEVVRFPIHVQMHSRASITVCSCSSSSVEHSG